MKRPSAWIRVPCAVLFLLLSALPTATLAATITLTAPNGGNVWDGGTTRTVAWISSGVSGQVRIYLYDDWTKLRVLTKYPASAQAWSWAIPTDEPAGAKYRIRIQSVDDESVNDYGDATFAVVPNDGVLLLTPNGGEIWNVGTTRTIQWASAGLAGNVNILLYNNWTKLRTLANVPIQNGSYSWGIPVGEPAYNTYRMRVQYASNGAITDYGDNAFTITGPKSVTVDSPNGGEFLARGAEHTIEWESSGLWGSAFVYLYDNWTKVRVLAKIPIHNEQWTWSIPADEPVGTLYRVRVQSALDTTVNDYSNAPFTIDEPVPDTPYDSHFGCGSQEAASMTPFEELGVHWKRATVGVPPVSPVPPGITAILDEQVLLNQDSDILTYIVINPVSNPSNQWPDASVFAAYLGSLAERYDGDGVSDLSGLVYPIRTFEICNEIDTYNSNWTGFSDAMYLDYLQRCQQAVHNASASATLFAGAVNEPPDAPTNNQCFDRLIQNGGAPYFDAISYHDYQYLFEMDDLQAYLASKGLSNKPIFVTESDMCFEYYLSSPLPTQAELADMLVKSYAHSLTYDNVRTMIFTELQAMSFHPVHLQWATLIDVDGVKRRSYHAYKKFVELADYFTDADTMNLGAGIVCCRFDMGTRYVYVVWAETPGAANLPTSATQIRVTGVVPDEDGDFTSTVESVTGGTAAINLGDTAVFVEEL